MKRGRAAFWGLTLVITLAAAGLASIFSPSFQWRRPIVESPRERESPVPATVRRDAFQIWVKAVPGRAAEFAAFDRFIADNGYAGLVPSWTLLRTNSNASARCRVEPFILPRREFWPNILPALKLVKEEAIPAVGRVEVASAFRLAALNNCSRGASQSRHLSFAALDLIPLDQPNAVTSFAKLCARWRQAGARSGWGLGAYYDPAQPQHNQVARFHVDGTGWRTWGFSYGRASSGCNSL